MSYPQGTICSIRQTAPIPPSSARRGTANGAETGSEVRTIDVPGLGWDAAVVTIEGGEKLLLIDAALSWDERMDVMSDVMAAAGW